MPYLRQSWLVVVLGVILRGVLSVVLRVVLVALVVVLSRDGLLHDGCTTAQPKSETNGLSRRCEDVLCCYTRSSCDAATTCLFDGRP